MKKSTQSLKPFHITMNQISTIGVQKSMKIRRILPDFVGVCFSEYLQVDDDLSINYVSYHPTRDLVEESIFPHGIDRPMMSISFGLVGTSYYQSEQQDVLNFNEGYTTISTFYGGVGARHYEGQTKVKQLRLLVGQNALKRYFGISQLACPWLQQKAYYKTLPASIAHIQVLKEIIASATINPLQLHIHALSLLAEQLNYINPNLNGSEKPPLYSKDIEKMEAMRELMINRMDQPLTIADACLALGINECKLKLACHHYFKKTPYQLLLELRMRRAHTLLESGLQVAQVAWQVGYRHPNNFSVAFNRFFGQSPKTVAKLQSHIMDRVCR